MSEHEVRARLPILRAKGGTPEHAINCPMRRVVVDCDGLALVRVAKRLTERASTRSVTAENPSVEGCGGDPSVRGPVEAAKRGGDAPHSDRTVLPDEEVAWDHSRCSD
jgi:hypothetical protein